MSALTLRPRISGERDRTGRPVLLHDLKAAVELDDCLELVVLVAEPGQEPRRVAPHRLVCIAAHVDPERTAVSRALADERSRTVVAEHLSDHLAHAELTAYLAVWRLVNPDVTVAIVD